jgi:hypothetical protein
MAMACFLLVTFLPLRPDLSVPFFLAFISLSTLLPAAGEYFRVDDFLADVFLVVLPVFFAEVAFFLPLLFFTLLFFAETDFFFAAFLVAMSSSSSEIRCMSGERQLSDFQGTCWRLSFHTRIAPTEALYDTTHSRQANQWIGDQPADGT